MKRKICVIVFISIFIFFACNPKVSTNITKNYNPIDYKKDIVVFGINEQIPEKTEILGTVKVGDSGFTTNCSFEVVLNCAKLEARKAGGNAIKIIEHNLPSALGSQCHRIKAEILKIDSVEIVSKLPKSKKNIANVDYTI